MTYITYADFGASIKYYRSSNSIGFYLKMTIDNCSFEFDRRASQYFSTSVRRCLQSTKSDCSPKNDKNSFSPFLFIMKQNRENKAKSENKVKYIFTNMLSIYCTFFGTLFVYLTAEKSKRWLHEISCLVLKQNICNNFEL